MASSAYKVGRSRPPISTRYKKGQSGNPSGRPKKQPSFRGELMAELGAPVSSADREPISKQRALIRTLVDLALAGNLRAMSVVVSYLQRSPESQDTEDELSERDLEILEDLEARGRDASDPPRAIGEEFAGVTPELKRALRTDFESFVRKAHGEPLEDPYIKYLCHELGQVPRGQNRRLIVSLPPRHLKTFACSVCLPAYILGCQPAAKVLVVTYGENLAADIAHGIREQLRTKWFKAAFSTRLAADRNRVTDFATTAGGGVYAAPIGGQLTGYGADYIVIDDPLEIKDADNDGRIAFVNDRFDVVRSRLNHPSTGAIVIVAHRLNEVDLAGHALAEGEWKQIVLPFEATRNAVFDLGNGRTWKRAKGELLRPQEFSSKECERLRKSRNFRALYQQDPGASGLPEIEPRHFALAPRSLDFDWPVVMSIDTGEALGLRNSYSVIQVWQVAADRYILADQWRDQVAYGDLRSACKSLLRRHRPTVVLIERAGSGRALASDLTEKRSLELIEVTPRNSKLERLRAHIEVILGKKIALPADAPWRHSYVKEFVEFPRVGTDQVDATTQFLDFMADEPLLRPRAKRESPAVTVSSRALMLPINSSVGAYPRGRKLW